MMMPTPDGAPSCAAFTGDYHATGMQQVGSTCPPSPLDAAVTISGDAASGYYVGIDVGGLAYSCNGIITGCRWDATCTGTAGDGSSVRGMLTVNFTNTSFAGTLTADFTGATNCHDQFAISANRS
jgi:hypothetical protein